MLIGPSRRTRTRTRARARTAAVAGVGAVTGLAVAAPLWLAVPAAAVEPSDVTAPEGDFALASSMSPGPPWTTPVSVWQARISDDVSEVADIVREVDWGEGAGFEPWTGGRGVEHEYDALGSYLLRVRLTDEAGNRAVVLRERVGVGDHAPPVTRVDRVAVAALPRVTVSGRAWDRARESLRSGVERVRAKAVQRRHGEWFSFQGGGEGWQRAVGHRAARRAAAGVEAARAGDGWTLDLHRVGSGRLEVRAWSRDAAGNRSTAITVSRRVAR